MVSTRAFFQLIALVSLVGVHADAWAKDRQITMTPTEVSGIHADCAIPASFALRYKADKWIKRIQLGNKKRSASRSRVVTFSNQSVDQASGLGRLIKTSFNFKKRTIEVQEDAVKLDNSGASCHFSFTSNL